MKVSENVSQVRHHLNFLQVSGKLRYEYYLDNKPKLLSNGRSTIVSSQFIFCIEKFTCHIEVYSSARLLRGICSYLGNIHVGNSGIALIYLKVAYYNI